MSTSCNLILQNSEKYSIFHRDFDGYPDGKYGMIPLLKWISHENYENFEAVETALVEKYQFVKVDMVSPFIEYLYIFDEDTGEYITMKYQMEFSSDY